VTGSPKLPPPDLAVLEQAVPEYHLLPAGTGLSRIHDTGGDHPSAWSELRCWGPHPSFRFDPHPDGSPTMHPSTFGVCYLALDAAAHAINGSGNKAATRAWARAFHQAYLDAHGLLYLSSMTGRRVIALFSGAAQDGVFPADPSYSRPLRDKASRGVLLAVADEIGYVVA